MVAGELVALPPCLLVTRVDHVAAAADLELDDAIHYAVTLTDHFVTELVDAFVRRWLRRRPMRPISAPIREMVRREMLLMMRAFRRAAWVVCELMPRRAASSSWLQHFAPGGRSWTA